MPAQILLDWENWCLAILGQFSAFNFSCGIVLRYGLFGKTFNQKQLFPSRYTYVGSWIVSNFWRWYWRIYLANKSGFSHSSYVVNCHYVLFSFDHPIHYLFKFIITLHSYKIIPHYIYIQLSCICTSIYIQYYVMNDGQSVNIQRTIVTFINNIGISLTSHLTHVLAENITSVITFWTK